MSDIAQGIKLILDGFRAGHEVYGQTAILLGNYYQSLDADSRLWFFDILWSYFASQPISRGIPNSNVQGIVVRTWAALGPTSELPTRLFSAVDWHSPEQAEDWVNVVGNEFAHSLRVYEARFSNETLALVKSYCSSQITSRPMQQAVTQLPPAVSRFGAQLENLLSKIEYERRTAQLRVDTSAKKGPPAQKSRPKASDAKFGRWKPVGSLPEGGQAHILLVEDSEKEFPGRWVLKRLKNISDEVRRARFQREVDVTRSLKHPNILKVIDSDLGAARPYFVAEYCPGGSLEHATRYTGDIRATVKVLGPIVDALVEAHKQKVFHRDIKPANLFLREDGSPVIGDFGICFAEDGLSLTVSSEGVGSRNFIAPEMETGRHGLGDPSDRTDVYSVGKVIYYMLAGGRVFAREDHRKISLVDLLGNQKFEHVHELLDKMIVEYPANRLSSREVNERLKAAEALVEGNFATLIPSIGIQCRFCGIGNYAILDRQQARPARPGLQPTFPTEVGVLRCPHCGHVEIFALNETESGDWFSR